MTQNKLSVIIPTLYKKPLVLIKSIEQLDRDESVNEIIIISNCECKIQFPQTEKLQAWAPETNAFVNPSWNLGIKLSKNNNFLLLNDDILLCENFCSKVVNSDVFNDPKTGLMGLANECINNFDSKETDDIDYPDSDNNELKYIPTTEYKIPQYWGSAIFGKKENYHTIPDCFKIIYGDNYLLYQNLIHNKINYKIAGSKYNHITSSSSLEKECYIIKEKDRFAWAYYYLNYIKPSNSNKNN